MTSWKSGQQPTSIFSAMELIRKYFLNLTELQLHQLEMLDELFRTWNEKINVISRKDIDQLYERHVLHSLSVAKFISFEPASAVLDLGTGGGFPGIPLAILFPEVKFTLCDSIGKKVKVVEEISNALGLKNVTPIHCRAEDLEQKFDFIVTRAVAELRDLISWSKKIISSDPYHIIPNGLIALKGGDTSQEIKKCGRRVVSVPVSDFFNEDFFREKFLLYVPFAPM